MPPTTGLMTPMTLDFPGLPRGLEGLRIVHVSDLHVRRPRKRLDNAAEEIAGNPHDLMVITGDSMVGPGDEPAALERVRLLVRASGARMGVVGVWGNHDSPVLRARMSDAGVRWLENSAWVCPDVPLSVLGVNCAYREVRGFSGDLTAALLSEAEQLAGQAARFRILISHLPSWLAPASACGVDLMLCGHTHGGQCCLPGGFPIVNATPDWPLRLSSGTVRMGGTRCVVSPGLGETYIRGLRLFCRAGMPLIALRSGAPGAA